MVTSGRSISQQAEALLVPLNLHVYAEDGRGVGGQRPFYIQVCTKYEPEFGGRILNIFGNQNVAGCQILR